MNVRSFRNTVFERKIRAPTKKCGKTFQNADESELVLVSILGEM